MVSAFVFNRAIKEIESARETVKEEASNADFVFIGIDEKYIYFNVVAKKSTITEDQIDRLKTKTRFMCIEENFNCIYKGSFKVEIWVE